MKQKEKYALLAAVLAVPVIIYFYFLKWKTNTAYGDDLYIFHYHNAANGLADKINVTLTVANKYRPVSGIVQHLIMDWFNKNLNSYYLFNVGIQVTNTFILARILFFFLRSPLLSLAFGLLIGLSRFAFYNITQLVNGGALEGLALTFFLLSLLWVVNAMVAAGSQSEKVSALAWSLLYANLCMYTHERYIVLFPFILMVVLFVPMANRLSTGKKTLVCSMAVISVLLNVVIKKYIYAVPFFVGTGGTNIQFSFASAFKYFVDGVFSIFQINSKPEYLAGEPYTSLSIPYQALAVLISVAVTGSLIFYISRSVRRKKLNAENGSDPLPAFIALGILFLLCMAPAVVTIRLEQRWLQASFSVFIVMMVIAFSRLKFESVKSRHYVYTVFILLFLLSDFNYLEKGGKMTFMCDAERNATYFKKAIDNSTIRPGTERLFYYVGKRDDNAESGMLWSIGEGFIFEFYQGRSKKIIYVDSVYQKLTSGADTTLASFNPITDQFIDIKSTLVDITNEFIKDSLKNYH